jgi:hypothetical protein
VRSPLLYFFLRLSIFCESFEARPGVDHGHFAIQIAHPKASPNVGMHLSKSTNHLLTPRTICFSEKIAPGGHAFTQI